MRRTIAAAAVPLALATTLPVYAQYPTKRITMIAPFPAQASASAAAHIIAAKLSELLGQNVVVRNRAGALGLFGGRELVAADADGYTVCFCNDGTVITVPATFLAENKRPPYTPESDFTPIGQAVEIYYLLIARNDVPADTFPELVAYAKAHPGTIRIASASPMGAIVAGLFKSLVGEDVVIEVPYKGDAGETSAFIDVMGGVVDIMPSTSFTAIPLIESGKVKVIGAVGWQRNPYLPNVLTLAEQSPEFAEFNRLIGELRPWNGLVGPKGMPREVVATLSEALARVLKDPAVIASLKVAKLGVRYKGPDEMRTLLERLPIVTEIVKSAGVHLAP